MGQFVLKIEKLSHIMGPAPILEMARAYGLRPQLWLLFNKHCLVCSCLYLTDTLKVFESVEQMLKIVFVSFN